MIDEGLTPDCKNPRHTTQHFIRLDEEVVLQQWKRNHTPIRLDYCPSNIRVKWNSYPRIRLLPAPVQPKRSFALCVALRVKALLAHVHGDVGHRFGQHVVQLFQMNVALLVDDVRFVEDAVHVALERRILVDLAVAKLFDGLCAKATTGSNECVCVCVWNIFMQSMMHHITLPSVTPVLASHTSRIGRNAFSSSGGGY